MFKKLILICTVTTKKITTHTEGKQNGIKRIHHKNSVKYKLNGSNGRTEEQKTYMTYKQLNSRGKSSSVITLNVNGLNSPIKKAEDWQVG